jgi:predicted Zn finger-like uncharacterized protein
MVNMANVKIHCPNCQQEYDVDEADLGREAECEACKKTFVLQADEPLEPPRRKTKTTVSVEKKTSLKHMKCEMCGGSDLVKQDGLFVCQHCGAKYSVEEARKMMVEGDGDVVVSGTVKIDDKEKLENLYTLARREYNNINFHDALKYYEMILLDDPNNWEPVFMIGLIKYGQGNHDWEDIANDLTLFSNKIDESVKLLMESENEEDKSGILKNVIIKITSNLASKMKEAVDQKQDSLRKTDNWNDVNRQIYIDNINKIALLYEKIGDICHQYLPDEKTKTLQNWKLACAYALSEVIHNQVAVKIMNEEPGYVPPPIKTVGKGCSVFLSLLLIVFVVFGILFFIAFQDGH